MILNWNKNVQSKYSQHSAWDTERGQIKQNTQHRNIKLLNIYVYSIPKESNIIAFNTFY